MLLRFALLFIYFNALLGFGQEKSMAYFHLDKLDFKAVIDSNKTVQKAAIKALNYFRLQGHAGITATDSVQKKGNWHYYYNSQKHYKKIELINESESVEANLLNTAGAINGFIVNLENNGFPFANLVFTGQTEADDVLQLQFKIDSGAYLTIGKIIIKSPDPFNEKTIQNMIHIKPGEVYNESKIKNISNLLVQNNLYEFIRQPELLFLPETVDIYLTIKKKNASIADGFIGFQQNPETARLELNGNVNLSLQNGLNRGELLDFKWQSNPDQSQNLDVKIAYPFIANLPIGVGGEMTIQKQDTTFIRNAFLGSVRYLAASYSIGLFAQSENSFLLADQEITSINFAPFRRNTFGFDGTISPNINSRYKPRVIFKVGAFNLQTDSARAETTTNNLLIDVALEQNIRLVKAFFYKSRYRFQDIRSSEFLTNNQLFYFGGLKSIRGFYELELNGNHVFSANNAIVFQPVQQLSLELIYDYAQFHSQQFTQTHSVGLGFNIQNETNTLSLILANGTVAGNPFNFQNSKLHLGFISRF